MLNTKILIIAGVEMAVLLLFLCGFLLVHVRGLRRLVAALEAKVITLRDTVRSARKRADSADQELAELRANPARDYGAYIDENITATRNHHLSLNPDRDIVLDISPDTPLERQAVSLRHAFLIAEKESWLAAEGEGTDWDILESKLGQIIQFYEQNRNTEELPAEDAAAEEAGGGEGAAAGAELQELVEQQKRRIENLELFKRLYFDTERKWREANTQAEQYHQELLAMGREIGAGDDFETLLAQYSKTYGDFGTALSAEAQRQEGAPPAAQQVDADKPSVGSMVIANQEEIQRLRNMAVDQHKMILQLRKQLEGAHSEEEKEAVIGELRKQLERHERFLKESDMCTKQLESELERVMEENHTLKQKLLNYRQEDAGAALSQEVEQLQNLVEDFTQQSCEMLTAIETLEKENLSLREQLQGADGTDAAGTEKLRQQLAAAQQELLNLQAQHIELEERYLELKASAD